MKRENRLTHSSDFKRVRRLGKSYAHPLILLQAVKREDDGLQIGIVVSKVIGSAVTRNRTKRRLKEIFTSLIPVMKSGWDIVIIPRKPITTAKFDDISKICLSLLVIANLIENQRYKIEQSGCISQ